MSGPSCIAPVDLATVPHPAIITTNPSPPTFCINVGIINPIKKIKFKRVRLFLVEQMQNTIPINSDTSLLERMRSRIEYDAETGLFRRLKAAIMGDKTGGQPGSLSPKGYHVIQLLGKSYRAHRLAWFYMYGKWPQGQIDHINGIRIDNRITNLRDVPQSTNMQNQRKAMRTNKSGLLGVTTVAKTGKFISQITTNDKSIYLGTFLTPQAAHAAYVTAKRMGHTGCTI